MFAKSLTPRSIARYAGGPLLCSMLLLCFLPLLPARAQPVAVPVQSLSSIVRAAETHALTLLDDQVYENMSVTATGLDERLRLRQCELPLEGFSSASAMRGGRVTVGVRCSGTSPWTLYVPVTISADVSVVQLRGPLPRGTILGENNLELVQQSMTTLPQNYLVTMEQAVGRELTRAVRGNAIATLNMLRIRELVSKGQEVVILAKGGKVEVRMAGIALEKGQQGQRINVKNSNSGRTVEAEIVNENTVRVQF